MDRLGIIVGEEEWKFFDDIYEDLGRYYAVEVFQRKSYTTPLLYGRLNRWGMRRGLKRVLRRNDICLFEWASEYLAVASHLPKTCPIITRLHRFEMYEWAAKVNWDAVDRIILVSEAKRREFLDLYPDQARKISVIPVGVSLEKFQPKPRTYRGDIGMLCNLIPRKRVYDLVLDFSELTQNNDGFHLHLAGGADPAHADYYLALQHAVRELGLEQNVTFYGHVVDTAGWYQNIDIFISNSYSEGLQVAPMEAMASGCYCLAHRWAGAEELLPQENLYATGQEMIRKIVAYADLSSSEKLGEKERMREIACKKFDSRATKSEIRHVIEETRTTSVP